MSCHIHISIDISIIIISTYMFYNFIVDKIQKKGCKNKMVDDYIFFVCENRYGNIEKVDYWHKTSRQLFNQYKQELKNKYINVKEISWAEYQIFQQHKEKYAGIKYASYLLGYEEPLQLGYVLSYNEWLTGVKRE